MASRQDCFTQDSSGRRQQPILVVERDANHLFYLTVLLQRFGYPVAGVSDARGAWDRIREATPSIIIAAFGIVGGEDSVFLEHLRSEQRTASVPVLAITSSGDFVSESRCRSSGAIECFSRPVPAEELYRAVQQAIEATPRRNLRISLRMPVYVDNRPLDCPEQGCETTLSAQGMHVRTGWPRRDKERVTVQFSLGPRPVSVEAQVMHIERTSSTTNERSGMRFAFVKISATDEAYIRQFIQHEVTQGIGMERSGPRG